MSFTVSKKMIEVELEYVDLGEDDIVIVVTDYQREIFADQVKKVKAKFERPKWSNYDSYAAGCQRENENGLIEIDITKLKSNKFNTLLREITHENGEKVTLNRAFFENVSPDFAIALVESFDEKLNSERNLCLEKMGIFDKIRQKNAEVSVEKPEEKTEEKTEEKPLT